MERKHAKIETVVDKETGEVLQIKSYSYSKEVEPSFIKMYVQDLSRLFSLPGRTDKVLYELLRIMDYSNIVELSLYREEAITKSLDCSPQMVNKAVDACIKRGILMRKKRRTYLVNPNLFARGKWEEISKIKMTVSYNKEGRMVEVGIEDESTVESKNDLQPNLNFDNESNN